MRKDNILKLISILITAIIIISIVLIYNISKEENIEIKEENVIEEEYFEKKEKYECNEFNFITLNSETLLSMYLNDYKQNIINDSEEAYNSLDKAYRESRFGTLEEYQKYINENINMFKQIKLSKYEINNYKSYDEYVCVDQYNNFYIFDVTAVMKYTLKLDKYTIDSEGFIEKYNAASTQEKVIMNIGKIFDAIEDKGYKYVYNKLDDTFKELNYKTLEKFSTYIKENLYSQNKVTLKDFTNEGNTYIYNLEITDKSDNSNKKDMTMIIQLKEKTDFVMSFSFE